MEAMFKSGAAALRLGVTVKTLQRRDRSALFAPLTRSPTGLRPYSESQLATRIGLPPPTAPRRVAAYCRVSSAAQKPSPEQEMVQDMMTIVHCFSSRLDGLRNYRRQLDAALEQDASHVAVPSNQP